MGASGPRDPRGKPGAVLTGVMFARAHGFSRAGEGGRRRPSTSAETDRGIVKCIAAGFQRDSVELLFLIIKPLGGTRVHLYDGNRDRSRMQTALKRVARGNRGKAVHCLVRPASRAAHVSTSWHGLCISHVCTRVEGWCRHVTDHRKTCIPRRNPRSDLPRRPCITFPRIEKSSRRSDGWLSSKWAATLDPLRLSPPLARR